MPDYIYLLENRLSPDQKLALRHVAEAARSAGMNVFLAGGAVRDLTSGSSVRDLDLAVQGNALKLKKMLEKAGGSLWGEHEATRTLYFYFPTGVRVEVSSTRREEYPKPGKPVYHWDSIHADLRRRDFRVNAMALSLNEHSYGLLMDPLNGVADLEARQLQLVSNYGFIEDPSRLIRAARLKARLGWELEEKTLARYQSAKESNAIEALSPYLRGYELEEIGHEEDGLRILEVLEAEGWMRHLDAAWTASKADAAGLAEMHHLLTQLQLQGVNPDTSAASMELLTAKLQPKDLAALKKMFVRPGFIDDWNQLDAAAKDFGKRLTSKEAAAPSATWKLFTTANPQAVLWLGFTSKAAAIQAKYKNFFTIWPEARQKTPHALMQEMRITQDLPNYPELLQEFFLKTIDGKLQTDEEMRAFLEPYSPPAPPPPVTVRRTRSSRKGEKAKAVAREEAEDLDLDEDAVADLDSDAEVSDDGADEDDLGESAAKRPAPISKPEKVAKPQPEKPEQEKSAKPAAHPPVQPGSKLGSKTGAKSDAKPEAAPAKAAKHAAPAPKPEVLSKAPAAAAAGKASKTVAPAKPAKSVSKSVPEAPAKKAAEKNLKPSKPAAKTPSKPAVKKDSAAKPAHVAKSHKKAPPKKSKPAAKPTKKK